MVLTDEIKDFIQALIKAKKNLHLYPENNPVYIKTLDDIYSRLTSVLQETDSITLRFKQYDILYDTDVVYHNEEKDESFALFFFKDGVRELTFKKGIPKEEFEEFMQVISSDFERDLVDDDIVTLMWEKDFQFISYVVDDTILVEDENYEDEATEQAKSGAAEDDEVMKAYEEAFGIEKSEGINIVPLTNEDLKSIVEEIENDQPEKSGKLISILFEMLYLADGKAEYEEISEFLKQTVRYAVQNGNLEAVIYCIRRINDAFDKESFSQDLRIYLRGIKYYINSIGFVKKLGEVLDEGVEFTQDIISEFASLLDKSSIPHFISILGDLKNISARKTVISILSELGKKDIQLLARGLNDRRWYVVRNIIYILRQIGDRSAVEFLLRAVRHSDKRVKKEAIRALGEMGDVTAVQTLKDCLDDEDEGVRMATVRAIGYLQTPVSRKILLEQINNKQFKEKSFTEKKEFFEAISRYRDTEVINTLFKILKKRAFFKRAKNEEMKAAAAYALGLMKEKSAVDLLEKLKSSKNRLLRENVQIALKRIRDGKE